MKKLLFSLVLFSLAAIAHAQGEPAKDSLEQYTGKYNFPDGTPFPDITVTLEKGVLIGTSSLGSSELKKTEGDVFEVVAYGGTATFKRNAENKITALHIQVSGVDAVGTREVSGKLQTSH